MTKGKTTANKPDFNRPAPDPLDNESDDGDTLTEDEQEIINDISDDFGEDNANSSSE